MDSSDFCAAFAPQVSQVPDATFQTRRPSMPRHAFHAANRLRRFFSASRILRRWPHGSLGVTRLNGKGSLTLRLTCLSDRASTVGSPLPPPVFLTDCRFLVSTNSFHFVSSIALLGAPKIPLAKGRRIPLQEALLFVITFPMALELNLQFDGRGHTFCGEPSNRVLVSMPYHIKSML